MADESNGLRWALRIATGLAAGAMLALLSVVALYEREQLADIKLIKSDMVVIKSDLAEVKQNVNRNTWVANQNEKEKRDEAEPASD